MKYLIDHKNKRIHILSLLFIGIICTLAYGNSLGNGFMLDDHVVLFGEKGIENKSLPALFTDYQWAFYRPVGHVFLWLCYQLFQAHPFGYHCANLLLFTIMAWLVGVMVDALTQNKSLALLTSLLYAIHPVNNMIVNYVTASVIGTFVICLELSLLAFIKFISPALTLPLRGRVGWRWYSGSLFFFLLAILSHEMSMIFPFFIVFFLYFIKEEKWKRILVLSWPYFAMVVIYLIFRQHFFSLNETVEGTAVIFPHLGMYLGSLESLLVWYVGKLFWPQGILFLWTGDVVLAPWRDSILKVIGVATVLIYFILIRWRKGIKPFALSMWVTGFFPLAMASFAYFPYSPPIIEPHWFYFASIGFFILVAEGWLALKKRIPMALWVLLLACLLGSWLFLVRQSNRHWRDQETYSRYWLSLNTQNMTPYYGLGKSLLQQGSYQEASYYFKEGLKSVEYYNAFILADLGYAEFLSGQTEKAKKYYQSALELDPTYSVIYHYWGQLYLKEGKYKEAEEAYQKAIELYPKNEEYRRYLSLIRKKQIIPPP